MALKPYTPTQQKRIASNVIRACTDIEALNNSAYKYLNLCSGFIAHYDLQGFKAYYSRYSLKDDIEANYRQNQWRNFTPRDQDYEYYMSKRAIYNMILGHFVADDVQSFMRDHFEIIHIGG